MTLLINNIKEEFYGCKPNLFVKALCEFTCSCILCFIGLGSLASSILAGQAPGIDVKLAWSLTFGILGYIGVPISGCHMDPAITFMFLIMKKLSLIHFIVYSFAQFFGCFCGAALTYGVYYDGINSLDHGIRQVFGPQGTAIIFTSFPQPYLSITGAIVDQIATTFLLCFTVRGVIDKKIDIPHKLQPIIIAFCVYFIIASYSYNSGGSMNPARDFAPRVFLLIVGYPIEVISHNNYNYFWIPIVSPFFGAILGTYLYDLTIGMHLPPLHPENEVINKRRSSVDGISNMNFNFN